MKETKTQTRKPSDAKKPLKTNTVPQAKLYLRTGMVALILAAVVLSLYGQSLRFGFTWFDDDAILLRNQEYVSDFSNAGQAFLRDAEFRSKSMELYRPLQNVSFMVDAVFGGYEHPGVFHFTNLLLHFLASFLLFQLMKRLGFSARLSLLGSLILAIHPVFAFTVCWLPARGDLLLAVFTLLSFIAFIDYLKSGRTKFLLLHMGAFFLALLAKESAVMIAPVSLLLLIREKGRLQFLGWQWLTGVGYLILTALFLVMRSGAVASVKGEGFAFAGLLYNLPVLPEVILKFIIPWPLVALPFYSTLATIAGIVLSTALIFLVIRQKVFRMDLFTAFAWFLLFSLPAMLYNPDWSDYIYDYVIHRSYLPLTGLILLVLMLAKKYEERIFRRPALIALSAVGLLWMVLNISFSGNFAEPVKFWEYAVKTNPRSAFAHTYLGGARFFAGMKPEAIESYNKALELKPDFREAILNRGITYASQGEHRKALPDFDNSLKISPNDTMVLRYRAVSLSETGEFGKAILDLEQLMAMGDTSLRTRFQYGLAGLVSGSYARSSLIFDSLVQLDPTNQQYLRLGALSSLMAGDPDKAIVRYRRLLQIAPPDQNAYANLAYALWEKGEYGEALENFEKAVGKAPENLSVNLGFLITYARTGDQKRLNETRQRTYGLNSALRNFDAEMTRMQKEGYLFTPKQLRVLESILK